MVCEVGSKAVCKDCVVKKGEAYRAIRTLVRDFPEHRFTVDEVCRKLRIDEKMINYLLEEGTLQLRRGIMLGQ